MKTYLSLILTSLLLSFSITSHALAASETEVAIKDLVLAQDMVANYQVSSDYDMPEYVAFGTYVKGNLDLTTETDKFICYNVLMKFSVKDAKNAPETRAENGTLFKVLSISKHASRSFSDPLAMGTQGLTIIKLRSTDENEDFGLELSCHTKEKYFFEKSALSHAPTVKKILEIFNSKIN